MNLLTKTFCQQLKPQTKLTRHLRVILLEVFISIDMLNSDCLDDMFKIKDGDYSFPNTRKLLQPKKKTTKFGLKSIASLDSRLWNYNVYNFSDAREIGFFYPKDKY